MDYSDPTRTFLARHGMAPESVDFPSVTAAFLGDMTAGLAGEPSSLRMIPTYLSPEGTLPLGVPAAVIDAGGTNFRTALVAFTEAGPEIDRFKLSRMPGSDKPVSWDEFISFAADRLLPLLDQAKAVGFCFSYPTEETPDRDGRLITLTKQVALNGFEGRLICSDLKAELAERGVGTRAVTLLNDTPAVLLSGAFMLRSGGYDGLVGLISGTGTNTCCALPAAAIPKLGCDGKGRMLINLESGGFSRLPRGDFDAALDNRTTDPGAYRHEKMTSGAYIGELCRLTLCGAAADGLFLARTASQLFTPGALCAAEADRLASGADDGGLFGSDRDRRMAAEICRAVFDRAARCIACNLAAILILTDAGTAPERPTCVCVDGSMFSRSIIFRPLLERYLAVSVAECFGRHAVLRTTDNATLLGAAAAALLNM
jgi:hexokinase